MKLSERIKNINNNTLFFGNIAKNNDYIEMENNLKSLTEKEYVSYLNKQIYTNSKICAKKYSCLFPAILIVIISLILLFI